MNTQGHDNLSGKKVLLFGLGLLGGGVATANWLIKQGAQVTISDLKTTEQLSSSLLQIIGTVEYRLGRHEHRDIDDHDIIVVNPGVSFHHPDIEYARRVGKQLENEATLFYRYCYKPKLAITGTRGKTTTVQWSNHFLKTSQSSTIAGNSSSQPLLAVCDQDYDVYVTELPSYMLEFFDHELPAPDVAIVTNISSDHLNRYSSFEEYVAIKARIFKWQTSKQHMIFNYDNAVTPMLLKEQSRAQQWFFSRHALPTELNGVFVRDTSLWLQVTGSIQEVLSLGTFEEQWGGHNLENLMASALAAHLYGLSWKAIQEAIPSLLPVPFRQEIIFQNARLTIINDTTATSPEGTVAAVKRFGGPATILISGGTDALMDYATWAEAISVTIAAKHLILLSGSATEKMLSSLAWSTSTVVVDTLADALAQAYELSQRLASAIILFSPGAKSFEKFNNEFHRGEQFNDLVKKIINKEQV